MALNVLAAVQKLAGTGAATLTGKLTGSPAISGMPVGHIGASSSIPADPKTAQQITQPGGGTTNQIEVALVQGQPASSPAQNANGINTDLDTYRFGSNGGDLSLSQFGDIIVDPRTVGEADDNIASISLTSQLTDLNANASPTGDVLNAYSRFFLQSVQEAQTEKYQVVETFTAFYTFFYGKRPPVYKFSGALMNDENNKWTNDLMFFYENFLRGTQSVGLGAQAIISYNGRLISGFLLNLSIAEDAVLNKGASFSFDVLVNDHKQVYFSADIQALVSQAQAFLQRKATQIQQQITQLNASVAPGHAALRALQATNGVTKLNSVKSTSIASNAAAVSSQTKTFTDLAGF